jgi:hypothetical protein
MVFTFGENPMRIVCRLRRQSFLSPRKHGGHGIMIVSFSSYIDIITEKFRVFRPSVAIKNWQRKLPIKTPDAVARPGEKIKKRNYNLI